MSDFRSRLEAFVKLGDFFTKFCAYVENGTIEQEKSHQNFQKLEEVVTLSSHKNGWFTRENILFSLKSWSSVLTEKNLANWLSHYPLESNTEKTIALIMAGNIPLVGFHDLLCVLITGNKALVKLASNDAVLLPHITQILIEIEPFFKDKIEFAEQKLIGYDAVIATGSDNTSRYFDYYFRNKPNIIRKNRNSVAVLTGEETIEQLESLGEDIFSYYGLGCRSVSKLFVPEGYDFDKLFKAVFKYAPIVNHVKYANNYDYNKAVYLMSEFKILDNGFLILKEDQSYSSPIASLFYETYSSLTDLRKKLEKDNDRIQCVVSNGFLDSEVSFGQTQHPSLIDYADGVDTVEFLLKT